MSRHELQAFRRSRGPTSLEDRQRKLGMLRTDLERIRSLQPGSPIVGILREQIRQLETDIAAANESRQRRRRAAADIEDDRSEEGASPRRRSGHQAAGGRFPPRGH